MAQVQFPCSGCRAVLAIGAELAGKVVACPRCKTRTTVSSPFEVVDEPPPAKLPPPPAAARAATPPPPPAKPAVPPAPRKVVKAEVEEEEEERARFPCGGCGAKMAVLASRRGQTVECPKCGDRTLVPDEEEEGTYGLEGKPKRGSSAPREKSPPVAKWWPDAGKLDVPATWGADLARAKKYAEREEWKNALAVLHNLQKRGKVHDIEEAHVLRKPLAYCLGRWAAEELESIGEGDGLSKPVRRLLKKAAELQRWAGSFGPEQCPVCDRQLRATIGTTQVRTVAGYAYVCCTAPTAADNTLVHQVHKIWKKLYVASGLDAETPEVGAAMAALPKWYRAIDMSQDWWYRTVTAGTADGYNSGGGGGGLLGHLLGDALGDALGELLG